MREGFPNMLPPTTPETPWCLPCPLHTHHGQVRVTVIGGRGAGPAGSAHPAGRTARGPARSFGEHLTSVAWGPPRTSTRSRQGGDTATNGPRR